MDQALGAESALADDWEIAQHFSAGTSAEIDFKSAKRTTERTSVSQINFSRPLHGLRLSVVQYPSTEVLGYSQRSAQRTKNRSHAARLKISPQFSPYTDDG